MRDKSAYGLVAFLIGSSHRADLPTKSQSSYHHNAQTSTTKRVQFKRVQCQPVEVQTKRVQCQPVC